MNWGFRSSSCLIAALLAACLLVPTPAHAYIDPGSGSMIMSTIIGLLVAFGVVFKTYWYKLKSLLFGKSDPHDSGNTDQSSG